MRGTPVHDKVTSAELREERKENIVAFSIVLLLVIAAAGYFLGWFTPTAAPLETSDKVYPVTAGYNEVLGNDSAKITVIEFSDYESEASRVFHRTIFPQFKVEYLDTGKANFIYRDFPLSELHPSAALAAAAAGCSREQGKFWAYHDALFQSERLSTATFTTIARTLGLDTVKFQECLATGRYEQEVENDYFDGINQGIVAGTPTFFINGRKLVGAKDYATFKAAIEQATG